MSLSNRAVVAVFWNFLEQISRQGLQFVTTIILSYFLLPEDFGLLALVSVFILLGNALMDSGMRQSLIRLKEVSAIDYDTAFYANVVFSFAVYAIVYIFSPYISLYYNNEKLIDIIRISALVIPINSMLVVYSVDLVRELNFKAQFRANFPSFVLGAGLAIVLAYSGAGVWSLIAQSLATSAINVFTIRVVSNWRPGYNFSIASFSTMVRFGGLLLLSGVSNILSNNVYIFFIGKLFSAVEVGYYFLAYKIQEVIVSQLTGVVQKVSYPLLSKFQDDTDELKNRYRIVIGVTSYIIAPTLVLLAFFSDRFFGIFFAEKWKISADYIKYICITGLFHPLFSVNTNILKVVGQSGLILRVELMRSALAFFVLYFSSEFGMHGVLLGQILVAFLSYILLQSYVKKHVNYKLSEQFNDFLPVVAFSVISGGVLCFFCTSVYQLNMLIVVFLYFLIYITACRVFKISAQSSLFVAVRKSFL